MTTFILACAGLVLLSGLFYLFPRRRRGGAGEDIERANLDWYELRREELAASGADEGLERDAQLRLLEDERQATPESEEAPRESSRFYAWVLLPVVGVTASVLYYFLGAAPDVLLNQRLQQLDQTATAPQVYAVMAAVEERAAQRPDNLHYRALLGRYYMGQENYVQAAETYDALVAAAPEDAFALAYAAQARYLAAGRVLDGRAQRLAEQALSINPHQRTALGLLGMASFEQGHYRAAIQYWERLQATESPGSESGQMIAGVIEQARQRLGEAAPDAEPAPAPPAAAQQGPALTVRIELPQDAALNPSDTVFVLARNPDSGSRMPIAVQRLSASQLPMTVRLDNSLSMAGQTLAADQPVVVAVQVSPSGQPGERNASFLGSAGPVLPSTDGEALNIVLQPRT